MSKCDHCPSLFHTSSQCKLNPKGSSKTPSEQINNSRIGDYLMFSDKVHESQMKKLVSPFSFSIDSLADKESFYVDKEGSASGHPGKVGSEQIQAESRGLSDQSYSQRKEGDQRNYSSRNYDIQRKSTFGDYRENRNQTHNSRSFNQRSDYSNSRNRWDNFNSRSVNDRLDNSRSVNDRLDNSRSVNDRLDNSRSVNDRLDTSRSVNDRLDNSRSVNDRLDSPRHANQRSGYISISDRLDSPRFAGSSRSVNQGLDQQGHKTYYQPSKRKIDDFTEPISDLSFTIQNDHSETLESRELGLQKLNGSYNDNNRQAIPDVESERAPIVIQASQHKRFKDDERDHNKQSKDFARNLEGSSRSRETEGSRTKLADTYADNVNSRASNNSTKLASSKERLGPNYSRITIDIDSDESSSDFRKELSVNESVSIGEPKAVSVAHSDSSLNLAATASHEKLSNPRSVNMTTSGSLEILMPNIEKSSDGSIYMIDRVASGESTPVSKQKTVITKQMSSDTGGMTYSDLKTLSYNHMKYEMKRRNAYAELDASISLEMSKMNSTISELEVLLFENSPKLVNDTSNIMNRLKSQKDCFKQLKDSYLKQLCEFEDQESAFIKENLELSNGRSKKRNASEAELGSENADIIESPSSKVALNSSPESKKDRINQEYVPSIFEESFNGFPANPKAESATYDSCNGLITLSSLLDGKPRSALFPQVNVMDSLEGISFSTSLENKLQVWDIATFSPIKSISFYGDKEKSDKVSLPEDMCWVSPNSILISSKCTEKVQDQPWNNLTLLYDLRRSTKTGAFKYKILNFKEHGHGSISAIKGLSNTNDKSTHWVTGGVNKKIFYWRIGDLSTDTTLDSKVLMNEHTSAVSSFHYCAHKDYIYSGGLDGKVFGYNLDGIIQTSFSFKKKIRNIHQIGSSPSTLLVTATSRESEFLIYDTLKNAPVMQFGSKKELTNADEKSERVRSLYQNSAVHPNGYLVCMGDHNTSKINMWDIRRPNIPLQFDVHDKGQTDRGKSKYLSLVLGFHALGEKQYLYSLGSDKRIVRIDLNSVF